MSALNRLLAWVFLAVIGSVSSLAPVPARAEPSGSPISEEPGVEAFRAAGERLRASDPAVRAAAADEMGRRGYRVRKEIAALLRPVLATDSAAVVRAAAGRALGRLGAREAVPDLIRALGDASADVRVVAAAALWRLPDVAAVPALLKRCADEEPSVREWSALALGVIDDPSVVSHLITMLSDRTRSVRLAAVRGLGRIGDPKAVEPLLAYLATGVHDDEDKDEVVRSLTSVKGSDKVDALVRLMSVSAQDPADKVRIIAALGAVGDALIMPRLRRYTHRDEPVAVRAAALQAISAVQVRTKARDSN